METLTKENFWDEMSQRYPKAMEHFKTWINKYKSDNNWDELFNGGIDDGNLLITYSPKYYELPIAMQFGIFLAYMVERKSVIIAQSFMFKSETFQTQVELCIMQFLKWWEPKL